MNEEQIAALANEQQGHIQQEIESRREDDKSGRKHEWGLQFDLWLIRAARNKRIVELTLTQLSNGMASTTTLQGIPIRVDRYYIQIATSQDQPWINKDYIVACREV